ncbi:MAG: M56 family metallopeptidase [Alistipes sp.]
MYDLLIYSLKVGACLAVFYLFFCLLMSRVTLHRLNRIVLLCAMVLSFVLPLCVITVVRELPLLPAEPLSAQTQSVAVTAAPFPWEQLVGAIFLLGAVGMLLATLCSLWRVVRLIGRGRREQLADGSVLVRMQQSVTPFSWGRYIVISERDLTESGTEIITHEQAHLRLHHSLDLLVTDLAGCLQWFNPAMWLLRRELRAIHEYEADQAVLDSGVDARQYQLLLIKKAVGGRWYSVANSFNQSKLKNRITMMLRQKSSRWAAAKVLFVLPITLLALGAFARTTYVFPEEKGKKENVAIRISGSDISVRGVKQTPLVFVDGQESVGGLDALKPKQIASIRVVKDSAELLRYGDKAKDGVIYVTTKRGDVPDEKQREKSVEVTVSGDDDAQVVMSKQGYSYTTGSANNQASSGQVKKETMVICSAKGSGKVDTKLLYIVDGQERMGNVNDLNPGEISSMSIFKSGPLFDKYKERGVEGVVAITTKRAAAAEAAAAVPLRSTESAVREGLIAAAVGIDAARKGLNSARQYMDDKEWQEAQAQLDQANKRLAEAHAEVRSTVESALNGKVISIRSEQDDAANEQTRIKGRVTANVSGMSDNVLVFINGQKSTKRELQRIGTKKIRKLEILKGDSAVEKYGEAGREGVLIVKTRK